MGEFYFSQMSTQLPIMTYLFLLVTVAPLNSLGIRIQLKLNGIFCLLHHTYSVCAL